MVEGKFVNNHWNLWHSIGPFTMPPDKLSNSPQATVAADHPKKVPPIDGNLVSGLAAVENITNQLGYVGIIMDNHGSSVQCQLG